jgi:2-polyprenyl-3-methyl-5-hydroxy-6-metoxy-1,4-benzoquinol methylase
MKTPPTQAATLKASLKAKTAHPAPAILNEGSGLKAMSEAEIRPLDLMAEQARLFIEDAARLVAKRDDFIEVPCPACDSEKKQHAFEKTGMPFVTCTQCETLFASPRPRPEHLADYYQNACHYTYWSEMIFPASEAARRENMVKPRVRLLQELCQRFAIPNGILMEVGAGFGLFCEEIQETKLFQRVIAVEPTPNLAKDCRQRGLEVIESPIEQVVQADFLAEAERIDVIVSFEVIEHLFSPRDFIQQCADLLETGGVLMLSCPNGKGFDIEVLGEKSVAIDVEHINLFNPASLSGLLESCGFEVIDSRTPGQLDAELVRNAILAGELNADTQPFLRRILIDDWEQSGHAFQQFLAQNGLSSHMLLTARKR